MTVTHSIVGLLVLTLMSFCTTDAQSGAFHEQAPQDSVAVLETGPAAPFVKTAVQEEPETPPEIRIEKELLYDKYTLEDTYAYGKKTRSFQWDKIKERLALLESFQRGRYDWGVIRNYKNWRGQAPLVRNSRRNEYGHLTDTLGVERYQGIPLYEVTDTIKPVLYGRDGSLIRILKQPAGSRFVRVQTVYPEMKEWMVPHAYVKEIGDTVRFEKTVFVDRHNQNICTLEKSGDRWLVRSMNPATTGRFRPPYAQPTPLGLFVLQEKKYKMVYLKDGSKATGGFAPYANRFTNGAYIHGVPVQAPGTQMIEYSWSLGTTPRSHMCVRNVTSHSKFIYNWGSINTTIVFVLE